jgi:1,4-alpha-glucan branching enzyme
LEVLPCRLCDERTLVVHAVDAARVEMAGDFTDWEPMPLSMTAADTWSLQVTLPPGTYRFNVRIDGGEWVVPGGVTRQVDEFGGHVGLLTIP